MCTMPTARLARARDLPPLLALFEVSEVSAAAQPRERAESIWRDTCMLITAPNLLREGRRHSFLENVVSHPELRGRGHGQAVVQAALLAAIRLPDGSVSTSHGTRCRPGPNILPA
jgi:GNAT superfamily N-acetyltransferase